MSYMTRSKTGALPDRKSPSVATCLQPRPRVRHRGTGSTYTGPNLCPSTLAESPPVPPPVTCVMDLIRTMCSRPRLTISRTPIAERLPPEMLCMVAGGLEESPGDDLAIATSKHQKNRRLVSMTSVCKTWKKHLLRSKLLWRDICFDTTQQRTIELAESFLDLLEECPFNLYVISSPGDVTGNTRAQLMARALLLRIRQRIQDVNHCAFLTPSKELSAYLDLPSSKVWYLKLDDSQEPMTLGKFSALRGLCVPVSFFSPPRASAFPELTTLSLRTRDARTSLLWMLRLLRAMPRLAVLLLQGFTDLSMDHDNEAALELPELKVLALTHCDFHVILALLVTPNLRDCKIYGRLPPSHEFTSMYQFLSWPTPPSTTTTSPHQKELISFHISIYDNALASFSMDLISGDRRFAFGLWKGDPDAWESWTNGLLTALLARPRPATEIRLSLSLTGPIPRPLHSLLLRFPHVTNLTIQSSGGIMVDIIGSLMDLDEGLTPSIFPTLRSLTIDGVSSFTPNKIDVIKAYVAFRASLGLPFSFWSHDCDVSWWPRGPFGFLGICFAVKTCSPLIPLSKITHRWGGLFSLKSILER